VTVTAGSRGDEAASGAAGSEVDDTVAGGNDDVTFEAKYDGGSSSAGGDLSGMYTGFIALCLISFCVSDDHLVSVSLEGTKVASFVLSGLCGITCQLMLEPSSLNRLGCLALSCLGCGVTLLAR